MGYLNHCIARPEQAEKSNCYSAAGRPSEKLDGEWLSRDRVSYYEALKP